MQDLMKKSMNSSLSSANALQVEVLEPQNMARRDLFKAGLLGLGGLVLGFSLPSAQKAYAKTESVAQKSYPVKAWLQLDHQGGLNLVIPVSEMGQGSQTAIAMILADELGADYDNISVQSALNSSIYNNPAFGMQLTGGSTAVRAWWQPMRVVGATLREMLVMAAAQQLKVDASGCKTMAGKVIHSASGQEVAFEQLIDIASKLVPPVKPMLKDASEYRYIGKPMPRVDTAAKTDGSAVFGMDVVLDDMLIATVAQSPVFGGEIDSYDEAAAKSVKGVKAVVELNNGIAVVADSYWQAKKGLDKLKPVFKGGNTSGLNTQSIEQRLQKGLKKTGVEVKKSQSVSVFAEQHQAVYQAPYLAHTTMEPMNATAHVTDSRCEVWAPTQNQAMTAKIAADISLLQPDQVVVHTTYLGGGFGRRAFVDYVAQAVHLSMEMERPVKVIWSREEDIQHDFYRPAAVCGFDIKTDKKGMPLEWQVKVVSDSPMASFTNGSSTMIDNSMSEGLADQEYQIGNLGLSVVREDMKIPVGFWRSVGHSYSGFFMEGMLNELALKAKQDPFDYRRALLKPDSRTAGVLNHLERLSNWRVKAPEGVGKGVALVESFGSFAGQVVEARLVNNQIKVDKVYCVIDCGLVVNPEIVKRQISSAVIYGLTAALKGKVHLEGGAVVETNFDNYPMLTMQETPDIIVEIVDSHNAPGGYGEPGVPPIAPALAAAVSQLTGKTYRELPIKV
ncbi:xanthine dehydrogenase family protein molybdopterin-binding subunit [Thiomicrorhabdus sediminis]|uniref:Xanthine dehydrogenase family protein molybdopterin-binding subunit n=1 Tax=Thiomicrorhabdus sediminis TaxID=2580412 RepID=A0A4P9K4L3_9GAMM|nr:molybdopterin cofactor-binding domain-containing protein [Thiomicrorhabdus sediminis]QCU89146.1 xanthine dehydrogenase family protein molybdopterin-binding subunit [Thiomicrorhabdus sediminis]